MQLYPGSAKQQSQVLTVVVPYELEVQSINGEQVPAANALFGTQDKTLHLQPGQYRINAFYKNVFDVDGGLSHELCGALCGYSIDGKSGETWKLEFERPATWPRPACCRTSSSAGRSIPVPVNEWKPSAVSATARCSVR